MTSDELRDKIQEIHDDATRRINRLLDEVQNEVLELVESELNDKKDEEPVDATEGE